MPTLASRPQELPQPCGFPDAVRGVQRVRGVSRRELADALGVHYQTVGYLERGEYNPSLHLALRIAEFFDLPTEVVFSTRPFPRVSDLGRRPEPPDGHAAAG